jgi:hypothetical protein
MAGMLIDFIANGTPAACWAILILAAWQAARGKL